MDSITKSETKSSKFNVVEYAVGNIFNRHIISTTDKPIIPSEEEVSENPSPVLRLVLYCSSF